MPTASFLCRREPIAGLNYGSYGEPVRASAKGLVLTIQRFERLPRPDMAPIRGAGQGDLHWTSNPASGRHGD